MSTAEDRQHPDLAAERINYAGQQLTPKTSPADPYVLFDSWMADAFVAKTAGTLPEPTAMVVATSHAGRPSARTVLLKEVDAHGFVFFTNYSSRKGTDLAENPAVALHFGWYPLQRQVRVEGEAARVSREETEAYFATRPRGSQIGAWASPQSEEVASAEALTESYAAYEEEFAGADVGCPPHWGGYRVTPTMIEFWQGQPSRMHDRLAYLVAGAEGAGGSIATWTVTRLAP